MVEGERCFATFPFNHGKTQSPFFVRYVLAERNDYHSSSVTWEHLFHVFTMILLFVDK